MVVEIDYNMAVVKCFVEDQNIHPKHQEMALPNWPEEKRHKNNSLLQLGNVFTLYCILRCTYF